MAFIQRQDTPNLWGFRRVVRGEVAGARSPSGAGPTYGRSAIQPRSPGSDDRFGAVGGAELGEDVGDVVADGFLAERQPVGDRLVGQPGGEAVKDVALAGGQRGRG